MLNQYQPLESRINRQVLNDSLGPDATGFFIRQLTEIETKLYNVLYKPLKGVQLFPISSAYNKGTEHILYNVADFVGKAKIIANAPVKDFPRVDVKLAQKSSKVVSVGDSFAYSIQDLRAAAMASQPLDTMKSNAARMSIEQAVNILIWGGYPEAGITGVLNNSDVPSGAVPADGTGGSTKFSAKDPQKILRDLNKIVSEIFVSSGGIHRATHLILPPEQYAYIQLTPYASGFWGVSILETFQKNNPGVTVDFANELTGVGTLGADVMLAFERSVDNCVITLPVPFEMFPPQLTGMEYEVNCHARCGGAVIRYPLSLNIKEGI